MMFRGKEKIAIGMAQPLALPGSFRHGGESIGTITEKLLEEVAVYDRYGYDGVILQNFNDIPVLEASSIEAVAYMTHLAGAIRREFPDQILGVLMIWDGCASLAVAEAAGADFVRVEHAYVGAGGHLRGHFAGAVRENHPAQAQAWLQNARLRGRLRAARGADLPQAGGGRGV